MKVCAAKAYVQVTKGSQTSWIEISGTISGTNFMVSSYAISKTTEGKVDLNYVYSGTWGSGTKYTVTSIEGYAFYYCSYITSITIPNSVTTIGECAFYNCTGLTSISIPNSINTIEHSTFYGCTNLSYIGIPNSVTTIRMSAFDGCSSLTAIYIPKSVSSIYGVSDDYDEPDYGISQWGTRYEYEYSIFSGCESLTTITVDEFNEKFTSVDGVLYSKDKTLLYCVPAAYKGNSGVFNMPEETKYIQDNAFRGTKYLKEINLSDNIENIGRFCFSDSEVETINIGKKFKFYDYEYEYLYFRISNGISLSNLKNINVDSENTSYYSIDGVLYHINPYTLKKSIEFYPRAKTSESFTIPSDIEIISDYAFKDCSNLTSITIPNSVTTIRSCAFWGCTELNNLTIPNNVTTIGSSAFYGCTKLNNISLSKNLLSIGDGAFRGCTSLLTIDIPNYVYRIGEDAFYECTSLSSVNMSAHICYFYNTFAWCSNLNTVKMFSPLPPPMGEVDCQVGDPRAVYKNADIYVPLGCIDNYNYSAMSNFTPSSISEFAPYYTIAMTSNYKLLTMPVNLDVSQVDGLTAYRANIENEKVVFETVDVVKANDVVLLYTENPGEFSIPQTTTIAEYENILTTHFPVNQVEEGCTWVSIEPDYAFLNKGYLFKENGEDGPGFYKSTNSTTSSYISNSGGPFQQLFFVDSDGVLTESFIPIFEKSESYISLEELTTTIQGILSEAEEGTAEGQYESGAIAELQTVLDDVCEEMNTNMSDEEIAELTTRLNEALSIFESKKVVVQENEDTDITQYDDVLYIENAEGVSGNQLTVSLMMNNVIEASGFQCDLYLPEGVTVAMDEDGFYQIALSTARTTTTKTNMFDAALQGDGSIRILCSSSKNYAFSGNEGEVATIVLNLDDDMEEGDYPIILKNIEIANKNNPTGPATVNYVKSTLTVLSYLLGDANGSRSVTVSDLTITASEILGGSPEGFIFKAADVTLDNKITVSDLTGIANIILYGSMNGPSVKSRIVTKPAQVALHIPNVTIAKSGTAVVDVFMKNENCNIAAYQFDMVLPAGVKVVDATWNKSRMKGNPLFDSAEMEDAYRLLFASMDGETFVGNEGVIAMLTLAADATAESGDAIIKNIELSENGLAYVPANVKSTINVVDATAISSINADRNPVDVFDMSGRLVKNQAHNADLENLPRGSYIIGGKKIVK